MNHSDFEDLVEMGEANDERATRYLSTKVATRDELISLMDRGLTVLDVICGGYTGADEPFIHDLMRVWNKRLGFKFFTNF